MAEPSQERLDELEHQIDDARQQAQDDGLVPEEEQSLIDPDADGDADAEGMENAPRMSDQNTTHSPRVDEQLAQETGALTHGTPDDARQEWRRDQVGAEGEPEIAVERDESDAELETRSRLAASLVPSAFPGTAAVLAEVAEANNASAEFVIALRSLPVGRVYETFAEVWTDLGGTVEHL